MKKHFNNEYGHDLDWDDEFTYVQYVKLTKMCSFNKDSLKTIDRYVNYTSIEHINVVVKKKVLHTH